MIFLTNNFEQKYYYDVRPDLKNQEYGDISDRIKLRKSLKCKSFDWYMKNIYPDATLPSQENKMKQARKEIKQKILKKLNERYSKKKISHIVKRFQIQLRGTNLCIESEKEVKAKRNKLFLQKCVAIQRQVS